MSEKPLSLYEYPTSLSSPKIEPVDLTAFKRYGVIKANDYFGGKWDDLLEEAGLTPSLTRQNSQEYAEEIARQAEIYKNMRMPKSEETSDEDEDNEESTA